MYKVYRPHPPGMLTKDKCPRPSWGSAATLQNLTARTFARMILFAVVPPSKTHYGEYVVSSSLFQGKVVKRTMVDEGVSNGFKLKHKRSPKKKGAEKTKPEEEELFAMFLHFGKMKSWLNDTGSVKNEYSDAIGGKTWSTLKDLVKDEIEGVLDTIDLRHYRKSPLLLFALQLLYGNQRAGYLPPKKGDRWRKLFMAPTLTTGMTTALVPYRPFMITELQLDQINIENVDAFEQLLHCSIHMRTLSFVPYTVKHLRAVTKSGVMVENLTLIGKSSVKLTDEDAYNVLFDTNMKYVLLNMRGDGKERIKCQLTRLQYIHLINLNFDQNLLLICIARYLDCLKVARSNYAPVNLHPEFVHVGTYNLEEIMLTSDVIEEYNDEKVVFERDTLKYLHLRELDWGAASTKEILDMKSLEGITLESRYVSAWDICLDSEFQTALHYRGPELTKLTIKAVKSFDLNIVWNLAFNFFPNLKYLCVDTAAKSIMELVDYPSAELPHLEYFGFRRMNESVNVNFYTSFIARILNTTKVLKTLELHISRKDLLELIWEIEMIFHKFKLLEKIILHTTHSTETCWLAWLPLKFPNIKEMVLLGKYDHIQEVRQALCRTNVKITVKRYEPVIQSYKPKKFFIDKNLYV